MDKTAFKKQSLKDADNNVKYWRSKTSSERLIAAYNLSLRAYGYDPAYPPKMDKTFFVRRNRN